MESIILIRGAGEMATGVAHKLWRCGFKLVLTEIEHPLAIRRGVAFAEAIYQGVQAVEELEAHRINALEDAEREIARDHVPVLVDPDLSLTTPLFRQQRLIVVDARMLKVPLSNHYPPQVAVVALGPGFKAPDDAQFVIETNRGQHLGRIIEKGSAQPNTGIPAEVQGASIERVIYSPAEGTFHARKKIGEAVHAGDIIGFVDEYPVIASLKGILRGVLHEGITVSTRIKLADIDPRGEPANCFTISDKARAIGGGVLEAVLRIQQAWNFN